MNPEKMRPGNGRPRLLQGEEAADLANEGQQMSPRRLRFGASTGDELADDRHGDDGRVRRKRTCQNSIEHHKPVGFLDVAIPGGALAVKKPLQSGRKAARRRWDVAKVWSSPYNLIQR
jgi:hypothetical protein